MAIHYGGHGTTPDVHPPPERGAKMLRHTLFCANDMLRRGELLLGQPAAGQNATALVAVQEKEASPRQRETKRRWSRPPPTLQEC